MEHLAYDIRGGDFDERRRRLARPQAAPQAHRRRGRRRAPRHDRRLRGRDERRDPRRGRRPAGGRGQRRPARRGRRRRRTRHPRRRVGDARGLVDGVRRGPRPRASAPAWACPTSSATATACSVTSTVGEGTRVSFTVSLRPEAADQGARPSSLGIVAELCKDCRHCLVACPTAAIRVRDGAPGRARPPVHRLHRLHRRLRAAARSP